MNSVNQFSLIDDFGRVVGVTFMEPAYLMIEPAYPFIYIPLDDFKLFKLEFFTEVLCLDCEFFDDRIKVDSQDCSPTTAADQHIKGKFTFTVDDVDGIARNFEFEIEELFVNGSAVFDEPNTCYIGVFPNTNAKNTAYTYAGTVFLKKYYTFFDMSEYNPANQ